MKCIHLLGPWCDLHIYKYERCHGFSHEALGVYKWTHELTWDHFLITIFTFITLVNVRLWFWWQFIALHMGFVCVSYSLWFELTHEWMLDEHMNLLLIWLRFMNLQLFSREQSQKHNAHSQHAQRNTNSWRGLLTSSTHFIISSHMNVQQSTVNSWKLSFLHSFLNKSNQMSIYSTAVNSHVNSTLQHELDLNHSDHN